MKCTICDNQTVKCENIGSYECNVCLSFFSFYKIFLGINFTNNNFINDNYISLNNNQIYYKCNGKFKAFDLNITLETDKEKYKFLKSFLDNMIFM